jgi:hypothetical protein
MIKLSETMQNILIVLVFIFLIALYIYMKIVISVQRDIEYTEERKELLKRKRLNQ